MELVKPPFTIKCTARFLSVDRFIKKAQYESNNLLFQSEDPARRAISFKEIYDVLECIMFSCNILTHRKNFKFHTDLLPFVVACVLSDNTFVSSDITAYIDDFRTRHLSRIEDKERLVNDLTCVEEGEKVTVYRTPFYPEKMQFQELVRLVQRELIKISRLLTSNPTPSISYQRTLNFIMEIKGAKNSLLVNSLYSDDTTLKYDITITIQTAKVITYTCLLKYITSFTSYGAPSVSSVLLNEKDFKLVFKKYPNILTINEINMEELINKKIVVMVNM